MKPKIKCAWCGLELTPTAKDSPRQHLNGGKTCFGSGQYRAQHDKLREVYKATAGQK